MVILAWDNYDLKKRMMIDFLDKLDHAKPKLILVDNHVSNYFEGASELNKKYNVNIMTFPANTTHLLQPLDNFPFSSFSSHLSKLIVKYLSPDEKGKHHNITSEQYPFLCYRAWQESFTANNIMQAWSKVGFLNYSFTQPIDKRFLLKKKTQPPKPSNQLAVINTNQEIVVHTPIITKETISAMRKHKTDGCDLTSTEVSSSSINTNSKWAPIILYRYYCIPPCYI
ncbi:hypothetical protein ACTFIY_008603 [Dictyostelium cf. discoideum]